MDVQWWYIRARQLLLALAVLLTMLGRVTQAQEASDPVATAPRTATLTFVGDVLLGAKVGKVAATHGMDYLFKGVAPVLRADDLTIGNLESPAATCGTPAEKQYTFRASPVLLHGLRRNGLEAVSLANNHTLDYGRQALLETMQHLDTAGVPFAGAGANLTAAAAPLLLEANGQRVALIAASRVLPSTSWYATPARAGIAAAYDPTRLLAAIKNVRSRVEIVAVYLHWGEEHATTPQPYQRALARKCIDAGADLVIGSHPHVLQGFEFYRGKFIAYSLGNFIFTNQNKVTAMVQITFASGALQTVTAIPCRILSYRPFVMTNPQTRSATLRELQQLSFDVRIDAQGRVTPR